MTVIALFCVDKFGRRKFLITGAVLMGISILTLGVVCQFEQSGTPVKPCEDQTSCRNTPLNTHIFKNVTNEQMLTTVPSQNNSSVVENISSSSVIVTTVKMDLSHLAFYNQSNSTESQSHSVIRRDIDSIGDSSMQGNSSTDLGNTTKGVKNAGSLVQKIVGFSALMTYVAAYGFSFGPGKHSFDSIYNFI